MLLWRHQLLCWFSQYDFEKTVTVSFLTDINTTYEDNPWFPGIIRHEESIGSGFNDVGVRVRVRVRVRVS